VELEALTWRVIWPRREKWWRWVWRKSPSMHCRRW